MQGADELIRLTAREAVGLLRRRAVSPLELIDAALARIAATDGALNALPTLCPARARDHARRLMADPPANPSPWYLHGLPIAVKDLSDVAGVRTTLGSPIYADRVPDRSDYMVETLEANGAIVLAKSNTPEFGAGANTFNEVFGRTCNPWDTRLTPGGSSGGSAAALAAGQVWLATGSDLGGSLRIPASFCSVVGLRPSPGRVAAGPGALPFTQLTVHGPMARTVADLALMLEAQCGEHGDDPLSLPRPAQSFSAALERPQAPRRVAFSRDLGFIPVDGEVAALCARATARFAEHGAAVEDACPELGDAEPIFQTLRAAHYAADKAPLLAAHRALLKPEVAWNIEKGLALTADEIGRAERARAALFHRTTAFFERYDLLASPAVLVPPFDGAIRYVTAVGDARFDNYVSWLAFSFAITLTTCPALSIPCGFTAAGLPVGLQLVGRP
ncbi:MAG: amidase, partial [Alphaproteobacteria bacterium]|nr:amidase [Alphaproteobacteria bacterium]